MQTGATATLLIVVVRCPCKPGKPSSESKCCQHFLTLLPPCKCMAIVTLQALPHTSMVRGSPNIRPYCDLPYDDCRSTLDKCCKPPMALARQQQEAMRELSMKLAAQADLANTARLPDAGTAGRGHAGAFHKGARADLVNTADLPGTGSTTERGHEGAFHEAACTNIPSEHCQPP